MLYTVRLYEKRKSKCLSMNLFFENNFIRISRHKIVKNYEQTKNNPNHWHKIKFKNIEFFFRSDSTAATRAKTPTTSSTNDLCVSAARSTLGNDNNWLERENLENGFILKRMWQFLSRTLKNNGIWFRLFWLDSPLQLISWGGRYYYYRSFLKILCLCINNNHKLFLNEPLRLDTKQRKQ